MKKKFFLFILIIFIHLNANEKQSIGIYTCKIQGVDPWDPDSIKSGIAGSEEAVIYISQCLSELGYQVIVYGNPPKNSKFSFKGSNPRYINIDDTEKATHDIAISWRMPAIGATLKSRAKKIYLWPHDTLHYPLTVDQVQVFDDVLWLSEWQRKQWISVNKAFEKYHNILGNGIEPKQFKPVSKRSNPYSCIYGSNYARGLEILLDIWPEVKQEFPDASLDIYYGWQHWNLMTPEQEEKMRRQIKAYKTLSVIDHKKVGHEELNRAYESSSIWTYPCISPETFCITALRAQAAGALPVIIEGTALKETVRSGFKCSNSNDYLNTLLKAMKYAESMSLEERKNFSKFVFKEYTWKKIAEKWHRIFQKEHKKHFSA